MHKLTFKLEPVSASRPRVTQYGTFYKEPYEGFRKEMAKLLNGKLVLYAEPLKLDVTFFFTIPKSYSKKRRDEMDGTFKSNRPDLDNLEKAVYDSMNGVLYVDDSQIVEHTTRKIWVKENARIEVNIQRL